MMKIYAAHTHAADDHTEVIFSAIKRERGMDVTGAVEAVSSTTMRTEYLQTDGTGLSNIVFLPCQCRAAPAQQDGRAHHTRADGETPFDKG
jgi:hypothetical protein